MTVLSFAIGVGAVLDHAIAHRRGPIAHRAQGPRLRGRRATFVPRGQAVGIVVGEVLALAGRQRLEHACPVLLVFRFNGYLDGQVGPRTSRL